MPPRTRQAASAGVSQAPTTGPAVRLAPSRWSVVRDNYDGECLATFGPFDTEEDADQAAEILHKAFGTEGRLATVR